MRLILVSNRLPVTVAVKNNKLQIKDSAGGVATGLTTYLEAFKKANPGSDFLWVGWPGEAIPKEQEEDLQKKLLEKKLFPVNLTPEQVESFYFGFCNDTIWPLFHSFPSLVTYRQDYWASYKEVNELFAKKLAEIIKPGDIVWVHDYQLMLLPRFLRERISEEVPIGFFLHIPFPVFEIYRLLPDKWRRGILNGILGADLAGFHTYDYTQYFMGCVQRILGYEYATDNILLSNRNVQTGTFPIGIDFKKFYEAAGSKETQGERQKLRKTIGGKKLILSIDRLDYTKGINKRLQAYEYFLEKNPQYRGKIALALVVIPSRIEVEQYAEMKREIDELVGKINGKFGTIGWAPIIYQYTSLSFPELSALYSESEVALITPMRDGMNMISKEYIASRRDKTGVLILSEMAGAASELGESILINPNHKEEIAAAILEALEMPRERQIESNQLMQQRLRAYDVVRWGNDFIKDLLQFKEKQVQESKGKIFGVNMKGQMVKDFNKANKRLLLLDYDGCLMPFAKYPPMARPTKGITEALTRLVNLPNTTVVVISGRDRATMDSWLKQTGVRMTAEHGVWIKDKDKRWRMVKNLRNDWMEAVLPVMRTFVDRVPGSFLEEKEYSLVWHYRMANPEMANLRAKELTSNLLNLTANMNLQVVPGNKIVEVRTAGTNKGSTVLHFLDKQKYDFVLAIGDDATDEDMFKAVPESAYTIKVRAGQTAAKYIVASPADILAILNQLGERRGKKK